MQAPALAAPRPALVLSGSYYGSLAAARCLGRAGIPVTVADHSRTAPALWSRFVRGREQCPAESDADALLEWLEDFGARAPRHVLYPSSDDSAFLISQERARLERWFDLYSPSLESIYALLNKRRLHLAAGAVGIETPRTWFAANAAELDAVAARATYPLLVKPVTQVFFRCHRKGAVVNERSALERHWTNLAREPHADRLLHYDPQASLPMLQELLPEAQQSVLSLSGFIDQRGENFVVRASSKVLQRPRRLGVGVCFENVRVDADLAQKLRTLCRHVGYFGVFETEFICVGDRRLLIDFNPRYYGQMGFDIARGVPLPLLAYYSALGRHAAVGRAVAALPQEDGVRMHFVHRLALELMLRAQRLSGALSSAEWLRWRRFIDDEPAESVDAVLDQEDWLPSTLEVAHELLSSARHPRAFLQQIVLNRS